MYFTFENKKKFAILINFTNVSVQKTYFLISVRGAQIPKNVSIDINTRWFVKIYPYYNKYDMMYTLLSFILVQILILFVSNVKTLIFK